MMHVRSFPIGASESGPTRGSLAEALTTDYACSPRTRGTLPVHTTPSPDAPAGARRVPSKVAAARSYS